MGATELHRQLSKPEKVRRRRRRITVRSWAFPKADKEVYWLAAFVAALKTLCSELEGRSRGAQGRERSSAHVLSANAC